MASTHCGNNLALHKHAFKPLGDIRISFEATPCSNLFYYVEDYAAHL
jgi:hypothetical protein